MNLAILTQYYPPEIGAPQARLSDLARRLVARGHSVTVLTGMPSYPVGRIHAGYGGVLRRERQDGVAVIRTLVYPTQKTAILPRLMNYASFATSSALAGVLLPRGLDYLLVESPPLVLGATGYWLSRLKRARLIFNVSDLWPESPARLGVLRRGSRAFRAAEALESFCCRRAWLVTGQSQTIVEDIRRRFPSTRTFHLSNGVDTRRFSPGSYTPAARRVLAAEREVVVLYAGLIGLAQGLDQVVAAAKAVADDAGLRFVLLGEGPERSRLVAQATAAGLQNLAFLDPVPFREMPSLLASADIIVITLKTDIPGAVPSKLYEAMASGKPVILVAAGEAAEIVRSHGVGIAVEPGDIQGLVRTIRDLRADPALRAQLGQQGRITAEKHFDRDEICSRFIELLQDALAASAPPGRLPHDAT